MLRIILLAILVIVVLLLWRQAGMIYFPYAYDEHYLQERLKAFTKVAYDTSQGRQAAFYQGPSQWNDQEPTVVWVMFHGNASLALHYGDFVREFPEPADAFLLVDYPGFGLNEGKPSPAALAESGVKAVQALAAHLKVSEQELAGRLGVFGFSLGAAAALQLAAHYGPDCAVLIAPFTRMLDMARRSVGWPLCYLLRHNFDNRERLSELFERNPAAAVTVFHGTADEVIPARMSKELTEMFPNGIRRHAIEQATHNTVFNLIQERLYEAMLSCGSRV